MILVLQFLVGSLLFTAVVALSVSGLTRSNPWGHKVVMCALLMWSLHLMVTAHNSQPIDLVSVLNAGVMAGYMIWRAGPIRKYLARH